LASIAGLNGVLRDTGQAEADLALNGEYFWNRRFAEHMQKTWPVSFTLCFPKFCRRVGVL